MSRKEIQFDILKLVVTDQKRIFATKDVSEDERMTRAHPQFRRDSQYHSFVGGALSDHHVALRIDEIRKSTSRGSRWEKREQAGPASPIAQMPDVPPATPEPAADIDLGPQCKGDSPFKARMRLHQSWYRANVLGVPYGTGPRATSTSHYGNMLTRADAEAGRNFLTPEIAQVAHERLDQGGGLVERFRLLHNMLSSQPMCFNLFCPLVNDVTLARQLLTPIVPEGVAEVTRVAIEWAPQPPETYLVDRTAFDTFIEYRVPDGRLFALGIETKLTEPFSQNEYDGHRYRQWMNVPDAPWRPEAAQAVHDIRHNQLWRDHLLAVALGHQLDSPYAKTRLMLVRHEQDHDCADAVASYRKLLRDKDDSLIDMSLDRLVAAWTTVIADGPHRDWIREFRLRYLELNRSAPQTVD